jgi:hypothetical protein
MKITAAVDGDLARGFPGLARRIDILSARLSASLAAQLRQELDIIAQSGRAADPEARRDALERAVRRIWGAPL